MNINDVSKEYEEFLDSLNLDASRQLDNVAISALNRSRHLFVRGSKTQVKAHKQIFDDICSLTQNLESKVSKLHEREKRTITNNLRKDTGISIKTEQLSLLLDSLESSAEKAKEEHLGNIPDGFYTPFFANFIDALFDRATILTLLPDLKSNTYKQNIKSLAKYWESNKVEIREIASNIVARELSRNSSSDGLKASRLNFDRNIDQIVEAQIQKHAKLFADSN